MTAYERYSHIDDITCDHHPDRAATHSNKAQVDHIHFLAVFHYCAACADFYLTARGRADYAVTP